MDLKVCDRCGRKFRAYVAGGGNLVPVAEIAVGGAEKPPSDPPQGLKVLNQLTVPLVSINDEKKIKLHCLGPVDACAECAVALAPLVQQWLKDGKKASP